MLRRIVRGRDQLIKEKEAWEKYRSQIAESDGFDFDYPIDFFVAPIKPYTRKKGDKWVDDLCREAIAKFNSKEVSDYEYVKVEKVNWRLCAGYVCYITFQARRPATNALVTFQCQALHVPFNPKRSTVHFCRRKKDLDQGIKSDVEAQDVADASAPIDSSLDQGMKSDVDAQAEAAASGPRRSDRLRAIRQRLENYA